MTETAKDLTLAEAPNQIQSVAHMLEVAIEKGIDPDGLTKLVELQERVMVKQAEMDFNKAMLDFQSECPPIEKNKTVNAGKYSYKYAELDHIAETLRPMLKKFGLSYSFESEIVNDSVRAACTVCHVNGHCRTSHFSAPVDPEAKMNNMQKTASALSYARRYALILALGLTTGELDDDGQSAGTKMVDEEQLANLEALIDEVGANRDGFLKFLRVDKLESLPASKYKGAVKALEAKRSQS